MVSKKKLALAASTVWLITYMLAKMHKASRQRESHLQRQQVTTWEGEGGNLRPAPSVPEHPAMH